MIDRLQTNSPTLLLVLHICSANDWIYGLIYPRQAHWKTDMLKNIIIILS